jgi:Tol biopolymer transport system component
VFRRPSLSPDGQRLVVDNHLGGEQEHDIWIFDLQRGTRTRLTFSGHNAAPVWTPDGTRVTFAWRQPPEIEPQAIYWKRIDSTARPEPLVTMDFPAYPVSWSSEGSRLAFVVDDPDTRDDIWMLPIGAEPVPVLATTFREHSPMISPDGRFLAYVSDESGREEIYVLPFPDGGAKTTVSVSGGREPRWSRDGTKLFFRSIDGTEMWSADVELEPTFRAGRPEHLFTGRFLIDALRQQSYDVSPDGERFLMVEEHEGSAQARAVIVLNWMEEVKRLLPVE